MALFDLVGRRWALTCLWALRDGPRTFREIQATDLRISPSTLNQRLADLREAQLIERGDGGYRLTPLGVDLLRLADPLVEWADRWAAATESPQDPSTAD
ncbi:helix-turn-helix domain-containing protein [Aeromicrobium sp. WCS2018Hpa-31]|nr:helix-turn-helix domain-containing protein [Aeromicrobium sp. WCS2018Hpa-31]